MDDLGVFHGIPISGFPPMSWDVMGKINHL
jgi:hypothetical protein